MVSRMNGFNIAHQLVEVIGFNSSYTFVHILKLELEIDHDIV